MHLASLLHVEREFVPTALKEAHRILKPDGIMYLSVKAGKGEGFEKDERYGA